MIYPSIGHLVLLVPRGGKEAGNYHEPDDNQPLQDRRSNWENQGGHHRPDRLARLLDQLDCDDDPLAEEQEDEEDDEGEDPNDDAKAEPGVLVVVVAGEAAHHRGEEDVVLNCFNSCLRQGGVLVEGEGGGANKEEDAEADADPDDGSRREPHEDDPAEGEDAGKEKSKEDDPPILSEINQELLSIAPQVNHPHKVFDSLFEVAFIEVLLI